jgi:glycine cleavage system aminomethyltransferase T
MAPEQFRPYKVSGAYRAQVAQKAKWVDVDGWRMPETFGSHEDEAARVLRGAGLQDVSALGKLDVKGTAVDGRVSECARLEGVRAVIQTKPGHALILCEHQDPRVRDAVERSFAQSPGCVHVTDLTSALAAFALVGPKAADVLASLTSIDLRSRTLGNKTAAPCTVAHVHGTIYRHDWGGLRAYLLLVGRDAAEDVWTSIHHAGEHIGLTPFGTAAQRLLSDSQPPVTLRAQAVGVNAR